MAGEDELFQMELNLHPNEASGLEAIGDEELLGEHGWDLGFWACLDEGEIEDCVAAIGHRRGSPEEEGWEIERLRAETELGRGQDGGRRGDHPRREHGLRLHPRLPLRRQGRTPPAQTRLRRPLSGGRRQAHHRSPGYRSRRLPPELRPPSPYQRRPRGEWPRADPTRQAVAQSAHRGDDRTR